MIIEQIFQTNFADRLAELKLELPKIKQAVGLYQNCRFYGDRLLVSGHGPWLDPKTCIKGKLGVDLDVEQGKKAARQVGLGILASVKDKLAMTPVNKIYLVKSLGMVNCSSDFTEHPSVIDGYSGLMKEVLGPSNGVGTRSAVGFNSLPFGIAVEIECEFWIR